MWEYIQTLFVLGESIINDSERVKKLVKTLKDLEILMTPLFGL